MLLTVISRRFISIGIIRSGRTGLDQDPTAVIATGDWVRIDADKGMVEVIKNSRDD